MQRARKPSRVNSRARAETTRRIKEDAHISHARAGRSGYHTVPVQDLRTEYLLHGVIQKQRLFQMTARVRSTKYVVAESGPAPTRS
jgi:hypothetical protein